jgi:hypothetical protein
MWKEGEGTHDDEEEQDLGDEVVGSFTLGPGQLKEHSTTDQKP